MENCCYGEDNLLLKKMNLRTKVIDPNSLHTIRHVLKVTISKKNRLVGVVLKVFRNTEEIHDSPYFFNASVWTIFDKIVTFRPRFQLE